MTTTGPGICEGFNGQPCFEPAEWLVSHELLKKPLRLCKGHCDEVCHYLRKNKGLVAVQRLRPAGKEESNG